MVGGTIGSFLFRLEQQNFLICRADTEITLISSIGEDAIRGQPGRSFLV
jgi:hypothetical protein